MTKEERIKYGIEGELAIKGYFESFGINLHHNLVMAEPGTVEFFKQVYYNMNHGDLIMTRRDFNSEIEPHKQSLFKIDVKRGVMITNKSLNNFRGQFFFLIPNGDLNNIENTRVIWRRAVESYISKATNNFDPNVKKVIHLQGDEYGYRLTNKLYREMDLKDFRERLVKRIITNPDDLNVMSPEFLKTFFVGPPKEDDL
jgi:hypothetical protein